MMKRWKKAAALLAVSCFMAIGGGLASRAWAYDARELAPLISMKAASISDLTPEEDTRVFKVDPSIEVKNVRFQNRFGIEVAGHMYLPAQFDKSRQYKAVVLSGPFGAVKEQSSGLYAQEMAKHGYVAVAFDPSFTGESGGSVRNMGSPEVYTEDFSAAVDFVGSLKFVDRRKIGAIGICGLSGPAVTAAVNDTRVKAVAVSAMYNMSESIRDHYQGMYYTPEEREKVKNYLGDLRWKEAETGTPIPANHEVALDSRGNPRYGGQGLPDAIDSHTDPVTAEFFHYYKERAYHPRSINSTTAFDARTPYGFFEFPLTEHVAELSPRPLLIITGDKAHSRYFSEELYRAAGEPKEMIVVPGATHTDLYDQMDKIPFDRLEAFFDRALEGGRT